MKRHIERMSEELCELETRIAKANAFTRTDVFQGMGEYDQHLLFGQITLMNSYMTTLKERLHRDTASSVPLRTNVLDKSDTYRNIDMEGAAKAAMATAENSVLGTVPNSAMNADTPSPLPTSPRTIDWETRDLRRTALDFALRTCPGAFPGVVIEVANQFADYMVSGK